MPRAGTLAAPLAERGARLGCDEARQAAPRVEPSPRASCGRCRSTPAAPDAGRGRHAGPGAPPRPPVLPPPAAAPRRPLPERPHRPTPVTAGPGRHGDATRVPSSGRPAWPSAARQLPCPAGAPAPRTGCADGATRAYAPYLGTALVGDRGAGPAHRLGDPPAARTPTADPRARPWYDVPATTLAYPATSCSRCRHAGADRRRGLHRAGHVLAGLPLRPAAAVGLVLAGLGFVPALWWGPGRVGCARWHGAWWAGRPQQAGRREGTAAELGADVRRTRPRAVSRTRPTPGPTTGRGEPDPGEQQPHRRRLAEEVAQRQHRERGEAGTRDQRHRAEEGEQQVARCREGGRRTCTSGPATVHRRRRAADGPPSAVRRPSTTVATSVVPR